VLVTTTANSINSVLSWHQGVKSALVSNDPGLWINIWMCVDDLHYNSTCLDVYDDFEWVCPNYRKGNCTISPSANGSDWSTSVPSRDNGGGAERAVIQYCLSQPVQEHCKLQFSLAIMVVVVLCNLVKAVCMGFIVWRKDPEPLVTLGDTVSSFLNRPDPTTAKSCISGKSEFEENRFWDSIVSKWDPRTRSWFRAASRRRWLVWNTL